MSITYSATTSRDWEVPSPYSLCNRLCLLTITQGDGTPMDASSISEEDIVELCIIRGHTHPLGVLHYSAVESIILFSTAEDSSCASRGLVDMTELHDEAITVWTMAPLETHVATFTLMWHSKPTTRDGELHTPPQQAPSSEGTLHCLCQACKPQWQWALTAHTRSHTGDHTVQIDCASNPLLMTGNAHQAVESPRKMTRRSPLQEGEGGVQRGNPPQFQSHQLGEGFPLDHLSDCHVLHQQDKTWGN